MAFAVRLRELAASDLERATEYYRGTAGATIALEFIGDAERVIRRIGRNPQIGSLRFAFELDLPGLRAVQLDRFPYIVFYVAGESEVDVWRIVHARRDLIAALRLAPDD